jgi:hypothetical protein
MEMERPVCGDKYDKQGLENHMRLTNGRGHGPSGEYPPDPDEEPKRSFDPEEYEIGVSLGEGEQVLSLEDAVKLSHDMLMDPESFGHVSHQSHRDLVDEVIELREAVAELTRVVDGLARHQGIMRGEIGKARGITPKSDHDGSPLVDLDEDRVIRE